MRLKRIADEQSELRRGRVRGRRRREAECFSSIEVDGDFALVRFDPRGGRRSRFSPTASTFLLDLTRLRQRRRRGPAA